MHLSIREARARFSELIDAANKGEHVVVTRHGEPVAEIGPVQKRGGIDWEKVRELRKELGIDASMIVWPEHFDSPDFSRKVLGLDD